LKKNIILLVLVSKEEILLKIICDIFFLAGGSGTV
jgi:hypothetical protein